MALKIVLGTLGETQEVPTKCIDENKSYMSFKILSGLFIILGSWAVFSVPVNSVGHCFPCIVRTTV